ncbi:MAG: hypothetical protein JOZ25_03665 [Actinobacteria bacterium]|nr:hypothetical protein [Actinomycetota bacterium]
MPQEISSVLFRTSVRALTSHRCSRCRRTPLVGELVHELESGQHVCTLCVGRVPANQGGPVRSERIHASERRLLVGPRAA